MIMISNVNKMQVKQSKTANTTNIREEIKTYDCNGAETASWIPSEAAETKLYKLASENIRQKQ